MSTSRWTSTGAFFVVLGFMSFVCELTHAERPIVVKTIQSLADGSRGAYLSVDNASNAIKISATADSGASWELDDKYHETVRDYLANRVRNRGDNGVNGRPLESGAMGALKFGNKDRLTNSQRWIVRYVGTHGGYHAYFIQNTNMEFLTLSGQTVKLERALTEGAYWHIRRGPSLPTDLIK